MGDPWVSLIINAAFITTAIVFAVDGEPAGTIITLLVLLALDVLIAVEKRR